MAIVSRAKGFARDSYNDCHRTTVEPIAPTGDFDVNSTGLIRNDD
jgi:hypothetical protein